MADSIHVQQADAIVSELNNASRSWQTPTAMFTATRSWYPVFTGPQLESLRVSVIPLTIEGTRLGRGGAKNQFVYGPTISLQKAVDINASGITDTIDDLDKLAQDIQDFYLDGHAIMTGYPVLFAQRPDVFSLEMLARGLWTTDIELAIQGFR